MPVIEDKGDPGDGEGMSGKRLLQLATRHFPEPCFATLRFRGEVVARSQVPSIGGEGHAGDQGGVAGWNAAQPVQQGSIADSPQPDLVAYADSQHLPVGSEGHSSGHQQLRARLTQHAQQSRTTPSADAVAINWPSGAKAT